LFNDGDDDDDDDGDDGDDDDDEIEAENDSISRCSAVCILFADCFLVDNRD
jgi:hypothetical protein